MVIPAGYGASPEDMQQRIRSWYEDAGAARGGPNGSDVEIARVGELWQKNYNSARPIQLHAPDGSHPNAAGSYLAALTIFSTIYKEPAENVSYESSIAKADVEAIKKLSVQGPVR